MSRIGAESEKVSLVGCGVTAHTSIKPVRRSARTGILRFVALSEDIPGADCESREQFYRIRAWASCICKEDIKVIRFGSHSKWLRRISRSMFGPGFIRVSEEDPGRRKFAM